MMKENYFELIDWSKVLDSSDKVYVVDLDSEIHSTDEVSARIDRDTLIKVEGFINYYSGHLNYSMVDVTMNEIVSRFVDSNNNLILFVRGKREKIKKHN